MWDKFKGMDSKQKVLLVGGSILVLFFLFKSIMGSKSSTASTSSGTTATVTDTNAAQIQQLADQSKKQMDSLLAMFTSYQDANTEQQATLADQNSDQISSIQAANLAVITNLSAAQKASDDANNARLEGILSANAASLKSIQDQNNANLSTITSQNLSALDALKNMFTGYQESTQTQLNTINKNSDALVAQLVTNKSLADVQNQNILNLIQNQQVSIDAAKSTIGGGSVSAPVYSPSSNTSNATVVTAQQAAAMNAEKAAVVSTTKMELYQAAIQNKIYNPVTGTWG